MPGRAGLAQTVLWGLVAATSMGFSGRCDDGDASSLPHVHLIATGGTIAEAEARDLDGEEILDWLPGLECTVSLSCEDFCNIGSSRMTPEMQFDLVQRVKAIYDSLPGIDGIVITHGTDSLEETAFLLDLLLSDPRPVVLTGAQRPPKDRDSDGPRNLSNAVRLAAAPFMRDMGVVVTMNDQIHAAREVRKTHTTDLGAFSSPATGPLGVLVDGQVFLFSRPLRRLHIDRGRIEPRVDLIRLVSGSDGRLVRAAVAEGARALVIEAFGRGHVPHLVYAALADARHVGLPVMIVSRTGGGRVSLGPELAALGVIPAADLDGLKARMLLIAALGAEVRTAELKAYVSRLAGDPQDLR